MNEDAVKPVNAVIYLRQSKDETGEELAVTRQREDAVRHAAQRDWNVVRVLTDNDISAAGKRRRPGFEEMLKLIESGKVSVVIAWAMDRISRNRIDTVRLLEIGEKHAITLSLVRGNDVDLSGTYGQMTAELFSMMARSEIKIKAERQRRAALQAAQAGVPYVKGRRAFGYEQDGMTVRPAEADLIRRAYGDVLLGAALGRIARGWNEQGFTTPQMTRQKLDADGNVLREPQTSPWTASALRALLVNPRHKGVRARVITSKSAASRWEEVTTAAWEPVVSVEVWEAVKAILTSPERRNAPQSEQALLTGIALCGVKGCTSRVHGGRSNQHAKTYRCRLSTGHVVRRQEPVDEFVSEIVIERLSRPNAATLLTDDSRPDAAPLYVELSASHARLKQADEQFVDGVIDDTRFRSISARLRDRIAQLQGQLADAGRADLLAPLVGAADVRATWEAMPVDRQRSVIDALMTVRLLPPGRGKRNFQPETVEITWK